MDMPLFVSFLLPKEKISLGETVLLRLQGPGGWYIENSLTTIGGKDPIGELNRELWNSGNESRQGNRSQTKAANFLLRKYLRGQGPRQPSE